MLFDFPYEAAGFKEEVWEIIPRTDKCIIRDYFTNGRSVEQTGLFGFYETDRSIREAVNVYGLRSRPKILLNLALGGVLLRDLVA